MHRPLCLFLALSLGAALGCGDDDDDNSSQPSAGSSAEDGGMSSRDASSPPTSGGRLGRPQRDGGSASPDAGPTADDPLATEQELEQLLMAYGESVEAECECFWSNPEWDYENAEECVSASSLGDELQECYLAVFAAATQSVVSCKQEAEESFVDCIEDRCEETDGTPCADAWADDDDRCAPGLAERFYQDCISEP